VEADAVPDVDGADAAGLLAGWEVLVVSVPAGVRLAGAFVDAVEVGAGEGVGVLLAELLVLGTFVNQSTVIGTPLMTAVFEAARTDVCDEDDWLVDVVDDADGSKSV
jgi:hypothetical protein